MCTLFARRTLRPFCLVLASPLVVVTLVGITFLPNLAAVALGDPYLPSKSFFGLDLDPYLNDPLQWPGQLSRPPLTESQIWERLERIAPYTSWVRSYAVSDGLDLIPMLARGPGPLPEGKILGLRTQIGTWIVDYGGNEDEAEIRRAFAVASPGDAALAGDIVVIGNEEIFEGRRNWGLEFRDYILNIVKPIRHALGKDAVPLTISEPWSTAEPWRTMFDPNGALKPDYADLFDTIDGPLLVNIHPYNERISFDQAFNYLKETYSKIVLMNPDKQIWIGETGWPSDGGEGATPENAARYLRDVLAWVDDEQIPLMYFMAYDVAWKELKFAAPASESHFGVWYNDGTLKIPGDYNRNGAVDAADYVVWRKYDGTPEQYDTWRANFGATAGGGSVTNTGWRDSTLSGVPEPASAVLLILGSAALIWRGERHRSILFVLHR